MIHALLCTLVLFAVIEFIGTILDAIAYARRHPHSRPR